MGRRTIKEKGEGGKERKRKRGCVRMYPEGLKQRNQGEIKKERRTSVRGGTVDIN